ncbi:MAG TPA: MotA/TolQ/ExbB proton channel family protein [Geminicoccus sp.]|jgi:biopolymer transport protein ExbB/TolQ|uniref:MotA/TolQ/ExbB proton channel family protein n=1 Tax=Geminicoccus sp. TaxID=2024832 RepID=UPI002E36BD0F|nr:MotA/TolQ/ExbB proton channel family protein [Geminicoccus sp.]HEX2526132.1 MotA/TolQ/ExbB proton channel family protein [Geminicoccus sp.]
MSTPQRYLTRTILFLIVVLIVVGVLHQVVIDAFLHNLAINGLILLVVLTGIGYTFRRILQLRPEIRWLEGYRTGAPGFSVQDPPALLTPLATVLAQTSKKSRTTLTAVSMRYLLDSIDNRLEESRDISRYLSGLPIFLGLLGTFWGLIQTMGSIGEVINGLSIGGGDLVRIFDDLKAGLTAPLAGMGTAFSASLFGLAGSLVLRFIDLQATRAQNVFYNELEEWLSSQAQLLGADTLAAPGGSRLADLASSAPLPAYVQALLQQTAENLEQMQRVLTHGEEDRGKLAMGINRLGEQLGLLNDHLVGQQRMLAKLFEAQESVVQTFARVSDPTRSALDEQTRSHVRNLDLQLARLTDELRRGREDTTRELRNEIKMVSRVIAAAAGEPGMVGE